MKSFAVPAAVLAALLGLCLWNGWWLTQRCGEWDAELSVIDELVLQEEWEAAEMRLEGCTAAGSGRDCGCTSPRSTMR